jgi:carbon-monoxide dehydrogenase small subunit
MMDTRLSFNLNGKDVTLTTDPLRRLIDVLREDYGLTGVKEGCSEGECGACSVLLNNRMVTSCIIPVGAVDGQKVMTIEGLRETPKGKTIIDAFADGGAVQCGFCIPGMVIAAYCILEKNPNPSEDEIRLGISGNICRCTGYDLIVESIRLAAKRGEKLWKK